MVEPLLAIHTRRDRSETVVTLSGECDLSNVDELDKAVHEILRSENRRIVLDVERLRFMGVCALAPIETAIAMLQQSDGIVVVRAPSRLMKWMLDYFGVAQASVIID